MRFRRAVLLLPALFALLLGTTPAGGATPHPGPDPNFGARGAAVVTLPAQEELPLSFVVAAGGRSYVLDGSQLLAFTSAGAAASHFGEAGRLSIAPAVGAGEPSDLVLDSKGRLLIAGTTTLPDQERRGYVIRLNPDGSRDASFGEGGEVDTDFGLLSAAAGSEMQSVYTTSIAVDRQDRPLVDGSYGKGTEACGVTYGEGLDPYVARLTASGAVDPAFAGTGHVKLKGPGAVGALTRTRSGNFAVFSYPCPSPPRYESRSPLYGLLTAGGKPTSIAWGVPLAFTEAAPSIDPRGRLIELEVPPPAAEGFDAVARYGRNGVTDSGFGRHGRFLLRHRPHRADAVTVDARSRPIVALSAKRIVLRRLLADGKPDPRFGPQGRLSAKGSAPGAIALDARGRIYTLSVTSTTSQATVQVTRFIPGR
jgi:uncharacterized delta-60 repeat protein